MRVLMIILGVFTILQPSYGNCIKGNCINGNGTLVLANGDTYIGQFRNKKLTGQGVWKSPKGDVYKGDFVKGIASGRGKLVLSSGDYYIGSFFDGKFHDKGKYFFKNGDTYTGEWREGKMTGYGEYAYASGKVVKGRFEDGVYQDVDKKVYNVLSQGTSSVNTSDFTHITKDCTNTYCHGELGIYYYGDGTKYLGEFVDGQPMGKGRCEFASGEIYEGSWANHAPHGEGIMIFTSGRKYAAIWDHGTPKEQLLDDYDYVSELKSSDTNTFDDDIKVFALVVGVATYQHMPSLKYTDDDAYQLYAFLKSPEGGAVPQDQIRVLVDDVATKKNILLAMEQLFSRADENDVVLLYMSGHGLEGSFIPSDFDGYSNQLSYQNITEILDKSRAKHKLCIADACHSGSLMTSKGTDYTPAINNYYKVLNDLNTGGTALLLSSAANEQSLEYAGLRQGVFSHFLMKGLSGAADKDHDKVVTISELYGFIYDGVTQYTQYLQSPILSGNYNKAMPVAVIR